MMRRLTADGEKSALTWAAPWCVLLWFGLPAEARAQTATPTAGVRRVAVRQVQDWDDIAERDRLVTPAPPMEPSPQDRPPLDDPRVPRQDALPGAATVQPNVVVRDDPEGGCPAFIGDMEARVNFEALSDNSTSIPPDTMGAIGRRHAMTMLNTQVGIQDRVGMTQYSTVSLASFWPTLSVPFDPKMYFDDHTQRWIAVCLGSARSANSNWAIQVSNSDDPRGGWSSLTFDGDGTDTRWVDFPCVGFNDKWIVVTFNMLVVPGAMNPGPAGPKMWVIDKAEMLGPGPTVSYSEFDVGFVLGGGNTLQPAVCMDVSVPDVLIVDSSGFTDTTTGKNLLRLSRITGPTQSPSWEPLPGSPYTTPGLFEAPHRFTNERRTGAQLGSTTPIEVGDSRACNAVFRAGRLYFCHTGGGFFGGVPTNETLIYWYQLAPTLPNPVVSSNFIGEGTGTHLFYPSIAVNCRGDMCIGYSRVNPNIYVSTGHATRTASSGTGVALHALTAGGAPYVRLDGNGRNRWGDYSATVVDPRDGMSFWTIQESATATANAWTTRWSQIPHNCDGPPTITNQPTNASVCPGSQVDLFVGATGGGTNTYQWFKNGAPIAAYGNALTINNATNDDSGAYDVLVYGPCGAVRSRTAIVQVGTSIFQHPDNRQVNPCESVQFTVDARGVGILQYQWHRRGALGVNIPLSDDGHVTGARTAALTIQGAVYEDEGLYLCRITDPACFSPVPLFSDPARLAILGNPAWVHRTSTGPLWRSYTSDMAYDPVRGVCVVYGGYGLTNGHMDDTWEWDGVEWVRRFPAHNPGRRGKHQMVFDTFRDKVLLFGGSGAMPVNNELWEYDGNDWTLVPTSGAPAPTADQCEAAFDSQRQTMLMFQPGATAFDTDTWAFHSPSATWTRAASNHWGSSPYIYAFAGMAYDPGAGWMVSQAYSNAVGNTWLWNGAQWSAISGGTPWRYWPYLAYDSVRRRVTMWGCCRNAGPGQLTTDTFALNPQLQVWTQVLPDFHTTQGDAVIGSGMAFDTRRRAMVIIGSAYNDPYNSPVQTWEYRYLDRVVFDRQPADQSLTVGAAHTFRVVAAGAGTLTYQWRRNGTSLFDGPTGRGSTVSGATTPILLIDNAQPGDAGAYDCVVTNNCGSVTSDPASLAVPGRGDLNCDGMLDAGDAVPFALALTDPAAYAARYRACEISRADMNADGRIDGLDVEAFVAALLRP